MLCAFAVLIACVPMLTAKGSLEHKCAGLVYLPVSFAALTLASYDAWRESSMVLFCFNCFCAYLLLSGWRATHERAKPHWVDWAIPSALFLLAVGATFQAIFIDDGKRSFYLLFFAINAFYLIHHDWNRLKRLDASARYKVFFTDERYDPLRGDGWMSRHIAGMVGSVMANISVVVLTLLPLSWHWIWPTTLISIGIVIAYRERQKKRRIHKALATILKTNKWLSSVNEEEEFRKAA
jgi:hypothetical protein